MDFDLSAEQKMLQAGLSDLLANAVDTNALVRLTAIEMNELGQKLDADLYAMGLAGILVPEEHGGLDMGLLTLVLVAEELGRHAAPSSVIRNALAAWLIAQAGSDIQRETWLHKLLDGSAVAAFALESEGWMPEAWRSATSGDKLRKRNVEGAQTAELFFAGLTGGAIGLALRDSVDVSALGDPVDGTRAISDLSISAGGTEPLAAPPELIERFRDAQLVLLAADAYGAGQRALDLATDYAKTRHQFDRPIGSFQALKHQLANMALEIYPSRFLVWFAAHAWDTASDEAGYASALAKSHVTDVAVRVARASVEAHGGIGYTWEYPLHLFLKRAMFDREIWGGVEEHRARVASFAGW